MADTDPDDLVPLKLYSEALDEVWRLRRALAYEAGVSEAHAGYKSFPKSRRRFLAEQVERMRESARGGSERAYAGMAYYALDAACADAGAPRALTRHSFESERPKRPSSRP